MNWKLLFVFCLAIGISSCGSGKNYEKKEVSVKEELQEKNRNNLPLIEQIRRMPGVSFRNGVPVIVKNQSDIYGGQQDNYEPLYVLNDYPVGNSFRNIEQLVNTQDVKEIEIIDGADASFYGSRAGNGVIKITTF